MEYFVLNEHSFNLCGDQSYIDSCLINLFDVYKEAVSRDFRQIRVTENIDSNWYEIDLGNQYTIRNWIQDRTEKDFGTRLKSLISSTTTPVFRIHDIEQETKHTFSEFKYKNIYVPALGATFLLNQLSLSINSDNIWHNSFFSLNCLELIGDNLCESKVEVKNITTLDHWNEHYELIKNYRGSLAKNKEERKCLIDRFERVVFTPQALKQIKSISDHAFFLEVWTNLQELEDTVRNIDSENTELSYKGIIDSSPQLNIADESDSVKENPRFFNARKFMYNGVRIFFGHHIRKFKGNRRLHFIIFDNKVVVGYVGKHLPTQKFPK